LVDTLFGGQSRRLKTPQIVGQPSSPSSQPSVTSTQEAGREGRKKLLSKTGPEKRFVQKENVIYAGGNSKEKITLASPPRP